MILSSNLKRFNELLSNETFICTQDELDDFQTFGYLIKTGDSYITRNGKYVDVSVISPVANKLNINLSGLVRNAEDVAKREKTKRIFCMPSASLYKFTSSGNIFEKGDNKYFRVFDGELWLVVVV